MLHPFFRLRNVVDPHQVAFRELPRDLSGDLFSVQKVAARLPGLAVPRS